MAAAFRAQSKDGESGPGSDAGGGDDLKRKSETPDNKSTIGIIDGENKASTTPSSQSSPSSSHLGKALLPCTIVIYRDTYSFYVLLSLNISGKSPGPPTGLFPPAVSGVGGEPSHSVAGLASSLSPLQRMASITDSLVSHPPMPPQGGQLQRPMRAVLPPITQQQFDKFQHLNTDETVRRVSH